MSYDLELELVCGVGGGVEGEGGVGSGMEEGTGGAGDAVGFHRDIGEGVGPDDVAKSVLYVHRDGYVLRGLYQQAVDTQEVILKCTEIHVADEELGAILVGVVREAGSGVEEICCSGG
ncbi:MAG: hypothetical protein SPJ54_07340 [Candidatus Onthomorpha sp.]|nr:hypothetical protein [Candidatus Onthomorpha sp.]